MKPALAALALFTLASCKGPPPDQATESAPLCQNPSLTGRLHPAASHKDLYLIGRTRKQAIAVPAGPDGRFCYAGPQAEEEPFDLVLNRFTGPTAGSPYPETVLKSNFKWNRQAVNDLGEISLPEELRMPVDQLEVRVRYPDGSPVAGARVTVDRNDGAIADANGIARLAVLHKSDHTVLAQYWVVYLGYWTRVWEAQTIARQSTVEITIERVQKPTSSKYMHVL